MKKPPIARALSKPIETNFVTADLLPKAFGLDVERRRLTVEDLPRVAKALEMNGKEWSRLEMETVELFEQLFPFYRVDRTGDDACDFQRLAFQLAERVVPHAGVSKNPNRIEHLFHLYGVNLTGYPVHDFRCLIGRLAEEIHLAFQVGKHERHRPHRDLHW